MKLVETSIPQNFATEYETVVGPEVDHGDVAPIFRAVIAAASDFLRETKKKNQKVCLTFDDTAGNFIMAAIVEYNKNEEEEGQDNWNYYYTFNKEDIKDVQASNRYSSNETSYHTKLTKRLFEFKLRCNEASFLAPMISMSLRTLEAFLEQNAKPNEEVTVEEDGYFIASVMVEDNEPVKALVPDSEMKILIKDDAATEKVA